MCKILLRGIVLSTSVFCLLTLFSCGGGSASPQTSSPGPGSGSTGPNFPQPTQPAQAPSVFFGMHQSHVVGCPGENSDLEFPLFDAPAGAFRIWSTCSTQWADMDKGGGSYDFSGLDTILLALRTKGINDAFLSLGSTPNYISSNPTDQFCDRANVNGQPPGMCDPPTDLDATPGSGLGDGTDLTWRNFVTALLQHVTAAGYSSSHAHISMYEIWSEFHRSDTVGVPGTVCNLPGSSAGSSCSFRGTFAQMLRMTQDMRCIVKGNASDPITGLGLTCGTAGYATSDLDPTALVMEGDAGGAKYYDGNAVMQNYLYCNGGAAENSPCPWSVSNPLGANATDVISGHTYFTGTTPEERMQYIAQQKAGLLPADSAKPYIIGEGSWGKNDTIDDPILQAALVARWYLALKALGVDRGYWYAWDGADATASGGLWSPEAQSFPPLECPLADSAGGFYCTGALGYYSIVDWINGATVTVNCPGSCSNPTAGMFTANVTRPGGYQAEIVWNSTFTPSCGSNSVCGATPLPSAPSFTVSRWRDVFGNVTNGMPSMVGASPIIVENMTAP
jgi:hypothetical protein